MKWFTALVLFLVTFQAVKADSPAPLITTLPDGVRMICRREPMANLVAITVFVQAGSAQENTSDAGIGSMVADAILNGTSDQDQDTIASSIGALGGNVKALWQPDATQIRALVLPGQYADAADLLSDILKNANFTSESVNNAREDMLSRIQERTDDIFESTDDRLRSALYDGTPYSLPQIGTVQTIKKLTPADLQTYFQRYYRPDNMLISVVGNVDPVVAVTAFADDLADFERPRIRHTSPMVVPGLTTASDPILVKSYRRDVTAGLMMAGFPAPGVDSPDYPAMLLANALLGGMKTSLMFKNLRVEKPLSYEVASTYTSQVGLSDITGYVLYPVRAQTPDKKSEIDQTPIVKAALLSQFKTMMTVPPSDEELSRAKKFIIGSYLLNHERIEDRSYYLGYSQITMKDLGGYEFDDNYADAINKVTADQVLAAAKRYFGVAPTISLLLPGDPLAGVEND